jgi:hypothetical protein
MSTATRPETNVAPARKRSKVKTILLTLVGLFVLSVGVVLAAAATKPATFRVERSIVVNAPPEKITPHLSDLKKWTTWSPWEKLDPDMKREYSGAQSGVGAKYAWDGDSNIGAGQIEINESTPQKVAFSLEFLRPMACKNAADFTMTPEANGTKLTWAMHGDNTFMGKVVQVFLDMDDMCGPQFDEGLTNLKNLAEKSN